MIRDKKEIETLDDVIVCMNEILKNFDGEWQINHQYHQILQIHSETSEIGKRLDMLEDKMNLILSEVISNGK